MTDSPLLNLPRELRDDIYSYMQSLNPAQNTNYNTNLTKGHLIDDIPSSAGGNRTILHHLFGVYRPSNKNDRIPFPTQPPITKVCRQLRDETIEVFYGKNDFCIVDRSRGRRNSVLFRKILADWFEQIRPHLHLIRKLVIRANRVHELIALLMDSDLPFKADALRDWDNDNLKSSHWIAGRVEKLQRMRKEIAETKRRKSMEEEQERRRVDSETDAMAIMRLMWSSNFRQRILADAQSDEASSLSAQS